jgi:hypothetical protein
MDMIARPMSLVEMAVTSQVEQIEFIDQPLALQHFEGSVNGDARDVGVKLLRAFQYLIRIEMPWGAFNHLQQCLALASEANAALAELVPETAGRLVIVDAFAGGDAMCGRGGHK